MLLLDVTNNDLKVLDPSDMHLDLCLHLASSLDYVLDVFHVDLHVL